jgi:hypothetical protein
MLTEDQELTLIRSVLVETFPGETRRVGKTNLNDIVRRRGQVRIVPMSGASRLDWTETLILLTNSAILLSQWLADRGTATVRTVHFHQTNAVDQHIQVGTVDAGQFNVSGLDLQVPPEVAGKLAPDALDRLISSFLAHMDALNAQPHGNRDE